MEVQELHEFMKEVRAENREDHKELCAELKRLNGTVKWNKFSIRAIWAIFGGAWAIFLVWCKSHL